MSVYIYLDQVLGQAKFISIVSANLLCCLLLGGYELRADLHGNGCSLE